jgi:NhaA family Na+:H+ antiporter
MPGTLDPPLQATDHVRGPLDAPHEMLMYGDFECPFCQAAQSIVARVHKRMGDEVRFVYRHFPIEEKHPLARHSAEASEAAAAQGAFWEMHDALYGLRGKLRPAELTKAAKGLGLDVVRFDAELADGTHAARIEADEASGRRSGVTGTPAFFLDGRLHDGAFDAGSLVEALRGG